MPRLSGRKVLWFVVCAAWTLVAHAQIPPPEQITKDPRETDAQFEARKAYLAQVRAENEAAAKLPRRDLIEIRIPKSFPRPPSAWRTAEKAFYEELLAKGRFDVLVVPFQVQDEAFSREIRSFMTAQLVAAMSAAGAPAAPDPYLVARALGDGERRYDLMQVFNLANKVGAKRIVLGYVGHDPKKPGTMRVTLHDYERGNEDRFWEKFLPTTNNYNRQLASPLLQARHFEDLAFSEARTPMDAYQAVLPEMVKFLGLKQAATAPAVSRFEGSSLPKSPLGLDVANQEPARDAYYFQLLAALAPQWADRARERLNEKSLLAVERMSPKSPDYRALKARTLMNMGLRPAAIHVLGAPQSAEERHLRALLDGNLPEVRASRGKVAAGVRAFIAALEENSLAAAYGARTQEESLGAVAPLKLPGEIWEFLAARALTDWTRWSQHTNIALKGLLDHEFPIEGFTAEAMLRGAQTTRGPEFETTVELSALDHVRRVLQQKAEKWCCRALAPTPTALDYLDLLEATATDNLLRRARFLVRTQGQPESAAQFIGRIERMYRDHPQFVVVRAEAELAMAKSLAGSQADALRRSAYGSAFNAWYWEQGQTRSAANAFDDVIGRANRSDYGAFDNFYATDYPFRPFYSYWVLGGALEPYLRNARAALQNSPFDFLPVERMAWAFDNSGQLGRLDELLASLDKRFVGHPRRVKLLAEASLRNGDLQAAEKHFREGIRTQPLDESSYTSLGTLLFEQAAPQSAAKVFMSYPAMADPSKAHPVGLSNYAYTAGSLFYWSGAFDLARPLYELSARLDTGSGGSLASEIRLKLLAGDYPEALRVSLQRAQRYRSAHAYRDAFAMLHAMGRSSEAWDGFNSLVSAIDQPEIWESALVGHWMRGSSEKDIAAWLGHAPMRDAGRMHAYAPMFLLRAAVTDRMPSAELPSLIAGIERPVWKLEDALGGVVRPIAGSAEHLVLGPNASGSGTLPIGRFERAQKTRVKSELVYFAEAYRAMRSGRLDAARDALREACALYDVRNDHLGYLLPYYAFAAGKTRSTAAIEVTLENFSAKQQRFDYYLAKAVLAGLSGRHEEADRDLKLALHRRPFTGTRPVFPEYQYAEILEWLFESTGNTRYRDAAVKWAKQAQSFQPWFAWAYAIEAKLGSGEAQRRAMAMTYYLDKNSERLAALPQAEVAAAVNQYGSQNPFPPAQDSAPRPRI